MQIYKPKYIYWERQGLDRMCGLNCINSVIQQPVFKEMDLTTIALQLDQEEQQLLGIQNTKSENLADDGNYSIQVITSALDRFQVFIESIDSDLNKTSDMTQQQGFICNSDSHWFSIRKVHNVWFNLNSTNSDGPQVISDFYLSAFLLSIRESGYNIFVVKGPLKEFDRIQFKTLNDNQKHFPLEQLEKVHQDSLKNKTYQLNLQGSDQAHFQQAYQNSLKQNYKDGQQDDHSNQFDDKFKQQEQKTYFQGNGVSLSSSCQNQQDLDEKFIILQDSDLLLATQISLESNFIEATQKSNDKIRIQFKLPSGKVINGFFNHQLTSLNDLYDFVIFNYKDQSLGQLQSFKILNNYPKVELTDLSSILVDKGINSSVSLMVVFI